MGLASSARHNAAVTSTAHVLVPAVDVRLITQPHTPGLTLRDGVWYGERGQYVERANFEVIGSCGHRLAVVRPGHETEAWRERIDQGRRHRRRCIYCPKETH